jgi:hypothetical protein
MEFTGDNPYILYNDPAPPHSSNDWKMSSALKTARPYSPGSKKISTISPLLSTAAISPVGTPETEEPPFKLHKPGSKSRNEAVSLSRKPVFAVDCSGNSAGTRIKNLQAIYELKMNNGITRISDRIPLMRANNKYSTTIETAIAAANLVGTAFTRNGMTKLTNTAITISSPPAEIYPDRARKAKTNQSAKHTGTENQYLFVFILSHQIDKARFTGAVPHTRFAFTPQLHNDAR